MGFRLLTLRFFNGSASVRERECDFRDAKGGEVMREYGGLKCEEF
jgi:hypothetical protein